MLNKLEKIIQAPPVIITENDLSIYAGRILERLQTCILRNYRVHVKCVWHRVRDRVKSFGHQMRIIQISSF